MTFTRLVERGLEAARTLLLCLSPAALGSQWVAMERSTVLFRDPSNAGRRFIPVLLTDCELPDTLRRYAYVDFRRESGGAFEKLLSAFREEPPAKSAEPVKRLEQVEPLAVLEKQIRTKLNGIQYLAISPDGQWLAACQLRERHVGVVGYGLPTAGMASWATFPAAVWKWCAGYPDGHADSVW